MPEPTRADFSAWAGLYARARPTYPDALFAYLAGLCPRRDTAWDGATGSGQAARSLAARFRLVVASDQSLRQVQEAVRHPRIAYRVATAERSALPNHSMDLATVAAAIHWFDLAAYYRELTRVVRPGGVAAAWTYHAANTGSDLGEVLQRFYRDVVRPYFPPGAALVEERYEAIHLPGAAIEAPPFWMEADWGGEHVLAFVRSWSGTQAYMRAHGEDPTERLAEPLARVFPTGDARHRVRWPVYLRVSRL